MATAKTPNKSASAALAKAAAPLPPREVSMVPLSQLSFDVNNPRFGAEAGQRVSEQDILNHLVETFGVEDVLSSIAVNGYFVAEPMIVRREGSSLVVVEGNRRLASCLILSGDPRAADQKQLTAKFKAVAKEANRPIVDAVACIVFDETESRRELLAYLGVRHIAASQGWDSYAKAAWIARAVEEHGISLAEISAMTGDQNNTVKHLLEGYYFSKQMVESGYFNPKLSQRRGRGSNPQFPFSWIYTLFFTPAARKYVGLPDEPSPDPVPKDRLEGAGVLLDRMFGTPNHPAVIDDSRDITKLARILDNPGKVSLLESGKHLSQIEFEAQSLDDKLRRGLTECHEKLKVLIASIESEKLDRVQASNNVSTALAVARLAANIYKKLDEAARESLIDDLPEEL